MEASCIWFVGWLHWAVTDSWVFISQPKKKKTWGIREAETGSKMPLARAVFPNVHINLKQSCSKCSNVYCDIGSLLQLCKMWLMACLVVCCVGLMAQNHMVFVHSHCSYRPFFDTKEKLTTVCYLLRTKKTSLWAKIMEYGVFNFPIEVNVCPNLPMVHRIVKWADIPTLNSVLYRESID